MEKVTYPNGVVLEWDETLQVGELITAYHSGYHILTGFDYREGQTPLILYVTVLRADGTKVKKPSTARTCDASYVRKIATEDALRIFREDHNAAVIKRNNLLNFLPSDQ